MKKHYGVTWSYIHDTQTRGQKHIIEVKPVILGGQR
jgi:hypothetical protein